MKASFDHFSVQGLSLVLLLASGSSIAGCSKSDSAQGEWPDPSFSDAQESTAPDQTPSKDPSPGQDSAESNEDGEESNPSPSESSTPEPGEETQESPESSSDAEDSSDSTTKDSGEDSSQDSGDDPDDSKSSTTGETSSDSTSSKSDTSSSDQTESSSSSSTSSEETTSSSTQDTGEDTSTPDDGTPAACDMELCVRMNDTQPAASVPWRVGMNMFSFPVPKQYRRLARIELFEGYGTGQTRASVRLDAGTSSAAVVERLQWSVNLPSTQDWRGANLVKPYLIQGFEKLWVVLDANMPSGRASIASSGTVYSIWHKANGSQSWTESGVALKFRAYCCKE